MITQPTVLILGAGASQFLKYPSGKNLGDAIFGEIGNISFFSSLGFKKPEILKFRNAFLACGLDSIDEFLEHRTEFIEIGKCAIAKVLIKCEDMSLLMNRHLTSKKGEDINWYRHLYRDLRRNTNFKDFDKNKISIITFNYDRSLEQFLFNALQYTYNKTDEEVTEKLKNIPFIHVHGQLAPLPWQKKNGRPYGNNNKDINIIRNSAEEIKIIHENIDQYPQFSEAHNVLSGADNIYFLGFGYHETNMKRLDLLNTAKHNAKIEGTCLGFTSPEQETMIRKYKNRLKLGAGDHEILNFLRHSVTFNNSIQ